MDAGFSLKWSVLENSLNILCEIKGERCRRHLIAEA